MRSRPPLKCACSKSEGAIFETKMDNKRFHCGHCNEKVSKTLYYQHKKLYYSCTDKVWSKTTSPDVDGEPSQTEDVRLSDTDDGE